MTKRKQLEELSDFALSRKILKARKPWFQLLVTFLIVAISATIFFRDFIFIKYRIVGMLVWSPVIIFSLILYIKTNSLEMEKDRRDALNPSKEYKWEYYQNTLLRVCFILDKLELRDQFNTE